MIKTRQKLGKYRIERRLGHGGFATVYQALDTIEGVRVALKVPHADVMREEELEDFKREVRLAAKLDHPNILPLKNATFIDGHFVITFALGEKTLAERLQKRVSVRTALDYAEQMLEGVAYAHRHRIIHCDVKPENLILFPGNRLRLTDFGISKLAMRTVRASGSGTVGYVAPEQAMGKPSFKSDVFSIGLVLYRMLAGHLPEWPYEWPPMGHQRLLSRTHPDLVDFLRKALEVDPRKRYADADQMLAALRRIKRRVLRQAGNSTGTKRQRDTTKNRDWKTVRRRQFQKQYGKLLHTHHHCKHCDGPVSEAMQACPWCGKPRRKHHGGTRFPAQCPRCERGLKLDWIYCPWCFGAGFEPMSNRHFSDVRYDARCANPRCTRKDLMPFMRYCPWCRTKVRRKWKIPGTSEKCQSCGWGVLSAFWRYCPWCAKTQAER
ncbi:MAG: serine/threonine-protein kinase [Pirellulales bacterium]